MGKLGSKNFVDPNGRSWSATPGLDYIPPLNTVAAAGGIVKSYGSGSNRVVPGPALTGEEGPEIVWNKEKGYAYVTGNSHPEI
jgi:hypothetical protein